MVPMSVGPPRDHHVTWWASQPPAGTVHRGTTHPPSRAASAWRCAAVAVRTDRPRSSTAPDLARSTLISTLSHNSAPRVLGLIGVPPSALAQPGPPKARGTTDSPPTDSPPTDSPPTDSPPTDSPPTGSLPAGSPPTDRAEP